MNDTTKQSNLTGKQYIQGENMIDYSELLNQRERNTKQNKKRVTLKRSPQSQKWRTRQAKEKYQYTFNYLNSLQKCFNQNSNSEVDIDKRIKCQGQPKHKALTLNHI